LRSLDELATQACWSKTLVFEKYLASGVVAEAEVLIGYYYLLHIHLVHRSLSQQYVLEDRIVQGSGVVGAAVYQTAPLIPSL